MTRTRIHNLSISLDGFATGEGQRADAPIVHAGKRLHEWTFATRFGRRSWALTRAARAPTMQSPASTEPGMCGDHRRGQARPAGLAGRRRLEGMVGPNRPFHTELRAHPRSRPPTEMEAAPPSTSSTPRRPRPWTSRGRQQATRTCASVAADRGRDFIAAGSSTTSASSRCRSCSAAMRGGSRTAV
jgi:hypothetical protein